MNTLLLRLAAPLQSWGIDAKFDRRGTEKAPSKSAVIGLVAAALGRRRNENLEDLRSLRYGVRVDKEGALLRDYHTVKSSRSAYVTYRYYLADAIFLAGLQGDKGLLMEIEQALRHPVFPLFLGRRSCPPEGKLVIGLRNKPLLEALREEQWLASDWAQRKVTQSVVQLKILVDADEISRTAFYQRDLPLTFDQQRREYGYRRVTEATPLVIKKEPDQDNPTEHDPMLELGGEKGCI